MGEAEAAAPVAEIEAAWNSHDMKRFAACFAEDADFVNVVGAWWRGRDEIEEMHAARHAAMFKDSTMRVQLGAFKEVGPGLGVMHVRWQLDGHGASGPGRTTEPRRGIWSWTVRERGRGLVAQHRDSRPTVGRAALTDKPDALGGGTFANTGLSRGFGLGVSVRASR